MALFKYSSNPYDLRFSIAGIPCVAPLFWLYRSCWLLLQTICFHLPLDAVVFVSLIHELDMPSPFVVMVCAHPSSCTSPGIDRP